MPKGQPVHVQAADNVAMACKATLGVLTHPVAPMNPLALLAGRTPARRAPFGAGEAQDASSCTLLGEVVLVLAVFPLAHALVMVVPGILVTNAMRVPNEDRLHPFLLEEAHDLARRFVSLVAHLPLGTCSQTGFGPLEFAPAARALGATRLLALKLSQALVVSAFETANATPTDDQSLPRACGHRCQVDLAEIDGSPRCPCGRTCRRSRNRHMQFVSCTPDEGDAPDGCGQGQAEAQRLASSSHGQNEAFAVARDRLGRPLHRHIGLGLIRVAHARVRGLELTGGLHIGQELMTEHLNALGVQGELSTFGGPLQRVAIWPGLMLTPGVLMQVAAHVPHAGGFLLCRLQTLSRRRGEPTQAVDAHGFHLQAIPFVVFGSVALTSVLVKRRAVRGCVCGAFPLFPQQKERRFHPIHEMGFPTPVC